MGFTISDDAALIVAAIMLHTQTANASPERIKLLLDTAKMIKETGAKYKD